ncbi:rhodanese-like domain-containing protein [Hymenobacter sediminis]|nr:rhodanese-like domain-containing protein [Hymenobacter sediminis]
MLFRLLAAAALLTVASPGCSQNGGLPVTSPATVQQQLAQPGTVLLDVRSPEEFEAGHLPGAQNLDYRADDFAQQVAKLDPKQSYVLYCASGNRSGKAAILMQEKGFKQVVNAGAYKTLQENGVKK